MAAVAILNFQNREFLFARGFCMAQTHQRTKFCQNRSLRFSNFQDGRGCHLTFLKSRNFIGYCGPEGGDASACQILSKSVNGCENINIFRFFKMAAVAILDFRNHDFLFADGIWRD